MKREFSAGVIIFKDDPESRKRLYLLLLYPKGHWDLAKGKLEAGETKLEAAIRELKEETNLEADLVPGFEESLSYYFKNPFKELVHKEVTFFVGRAIGDDVKVSHEHLGFQWVPFLDAVHQLTFDNAKNMITKAEQFLSYGY